MNKLAASFGKLGPVVHRDLENREGGGREFDLSLVEQGVLVLRCDQFEDHVAKAGVMAREQESELGSQFQEARAQLVKLYARLPAGHREFVLNGKSTGSKTSEISVPNRTMCCPVCGTNCPIELNLRRRF